MAMRLGQIGRREIDHHDAAIGRDQLEHLVRDVARMIVERARARMREDHRRLADAQRVAHRASLTWLQIDQHAEPVELVHHRLAERGEPVMLGIVGRRIRPFDRLGVGQRQIARAEIMIGAQHREAVVDLAAALDADHRGDAPALVDAAHVGGGARQREGLRIARDDILDQIDLLERLLDLLGRRQAGRRHRPTRTARRPCPAAAARCRCCRASACVPSPCAQVERPAAFALAFAQRLPPSRYARRSAASPSARARPRGIRRGRRARRRAAAAARRREGLCSSQRA